MHKQYTFNAQKIHVSCSNNTHLKHKKYTFNAQKIHIEFEFDSMGLNEKKIIKFRKDELDHKDIAYEEGATKEGPYSILDKLIKTGSKIAINISEKI